MADYQSFDAFGDIIYCELCKSKNIDTTALKFCTDCSKHLCSACESLHSSTKATKDHLIIDKIDKHIEVEIKANTIMSESKKCEPCAETGKDFDALTYCEECEELLCGDCTSSHKVFKATRKHTPIGIDEMKLEGCKECEPCQYKGLGIKALKFCIDCEELLCENCSKSHEFQKATKHHTQIGIEDISQKSIRECDLCKSLNKHGIAASFCNDCEEAFCKICAITHISQKATKSHTLIDIGKIREVIQLCEPCQQSGKSISAFKYCLDCEELLAENCTNVHQTQKATKLHQLLKATEKSSYSRDKLCDNCKLVDKSISAGTYCNDCEEYYCNICTKSHQSMKATRNHKLSDAKDIESNKPNNCDQCFIDKLNKQADYFCNDCAEFYCEKCHSSHKRVKASRHHITVSENEARNRLNTKCDPCELFNSSDVRACHYCHECQEFLCQTCSKEHKEQKTTRDHQLITATEGNKFKTNEHKIFCEPCKEVSINKHATSICQDCRDPMCDDCSRKHVRQKPTRDHKIINNQNLLREILIANPEQQVATDLKSLSDELENVGLNKKDENGASVQPKEENELPGKPIASDIKADSIRLTWDKPEKFLPTDNYQIRYKDLDVNGKWKFVQKDHNVATATLTDLKANTRFIFQVRVVHEDGERPYSPESDVVTTSSSPATRIVTFAAVTRKGNPSPNVHALPITENRPGRNVAAKTKKFEIGSPPYALKQEKTIMLVGATGTGKSTLVDGLVNYILGVKWDDPFRFSIIDLEQEEKDRHQNQALSQTEWITCYSINPEQGSRLGYRLNIIDTPGFGDTRGLKRDQEIVDQIRNLFSEKGEKGIANIDAVCFLVKAPDARLTAVQTYIFQSIMALFGQDIEHNITTLVTFADGVEPPVLAALDQSGLPFGKPFTFNNSGLFTKNVDLGPNSLSPMFWDMGGSSFRAFFAHLDKMETKSLQQSKQVLEERRRLETTIQNLQPQVDAGLSKLNELKTELKIFEQHKADIAANKDFEYEVKETQQNKSELPKGLHVTNCLHCHMTCHQNCAYANDDEKQKCCAMDGNGNCRECSSKCHWSQHANTPYIFEYTEVTKKKTYAEKLAKYKKLTGQKVTHKKIIETMSNELVELETGIEDLMHIVKDCNDRLKEIALRPNPLNMVEHIDLMIEAEKLEKKEGFQQRIAMLNEFRQKAEIALRVKDFSTQANATRRTVQSSTNNDVAVDKATPSIGSSITKFFNKLF